MTITQNQCRVPIPRLPLDLFHALLAITGVSRKVPSRYQRKIYYICTYIAYMRKYTVPTPEITQHSLVDLVPPPHLKNRRFAQALVRRHCEGQRMLFFQSTAPAQVHSRKNTVCHQCGHTPIQVGAQIQRSRAHVRKATTGNQRGLVHGYVPGLRVAVA